MNKQKIFSEIQGNVLKAHNRNFSMFIFFGWKPGNEFQDYRNWVKAIGKHVTSHQDQLKGTSDYNDNNTQTFVINLGLTYQGLTMMKLESKTTDCEFKAGMKNGVEKYFKPDNYRLQTKLIRDDADKLLMGRKSHHVLLCVAHDVKESLTSYCEKILADSSCQKLLDKEQLTTLLIEQKRHPKEEKEKKGRPFGPFGFEDNISSLKAEKDILKHAFGSVADTKGDTYDGGTYMAIQKIQLHKDKFDYHAKNIASLLKDKNRGHTNTALGKALLIGRFENGTPLATSEYPSNCPRDTTNNFHYLDDKLGSKCPLHAHIRSTNPRINGCDEPVPIVRRGIVYDDEYREKTKEKESLFFISFQSSITNNLLPIYKRMLSGINNKPWKTDAIVYPHRDKPPISSKLKYYYKYGTVNENDKVEYPRVGQDLTTIVSGAFYYCPSKTFLDDPK